MLLEQLMMDGADPNVRDAHGRTALMWAVHKGKEAWMVQFLEVGAKPDLRERKGATALMLAARLGYLPAGSGHGARRVPEEARPSQVERLDGPFQ